MTKKACCSPPGGRFLFQKGVNFVRETKCIEPYIVTGTDAADFQAKLRAVLRGVENPQITFPPAPPFTAYILVEESKQIAECRTEEHMLAHDTYICKACPYFEYTNDMRRKWHYCTYHQNRMRDDAPCCEDFYVQLDRGTIEPRKEVKR